MQSFTVTKSFDFNGSTYLIEIESMQLVVRVQALTSDHQPCGFAYFVPMPQNYYMDALLASSVVRALVEEAKRDVFENRWNNDLAGLEKNIAANRVKYLDERDNRTGFMVHTDVFDRSLTKDRYMEFLERMNFHGYPMQGYGISSVRQGDEEGKIWVYRYSESSD